MKKRLALAIAAALTIGATGTAFAAANPFVDVPAKHWAYDAVTKLAKDGIVDGYNDGTFRGNNNITRYEMAQIVAKAMAKADKANAEDKALINKLATEFSDELNNLGVRVSNLEKNQQNLKLTGTAEIRYTATDFEGNKASDAGAAYRLRLDGVAKVDDKTTYGMRFTTGVTKNGDDGYRYISGTTTGFGSLQTDDNKNTFTLDRMYVTRQMGVVNTTVGAQMLKLGATNFIIDSGAYSFDGVKFQGKAGVFDVTTQWGRQQKTTIKDSDGTAIGETRLDVASIELASKHGKLNYGLGYANFEDNGTADKTMATLYYGNAFYAFDKKVTVGGEYVTNTEDNNGLGDGGSAWNAQLIYGDAVIADKGQNNLTVKYYDVEKNSISRFTSFDLQDKDGKSGAFADVKNLKGWNVTYNYGFSKNFAGYLSYVKVDDKDATSKADDKGFDFFRAAVVAKF